MAALTGPRNTPRLGEEYTPLEAGVKTNTVIFNGSLVMADATGYLVPGAAAVGARAAGRADTGSDPKVDTTGIASGATKLKVDVGTFRWNNSSAGDAITQTEMYKDVYIVDDQTVAKTDGSGTRSVAGKVKLIDAQGVWVQTGPL